MAITGMLPLLQTFRGQSKPALPMIRRLLVTMTMITAQQSLGPCERQCPLLG